MTVIKFEVGKTYSERFISDYDQSAHFEITGRTNKTIKTTVHGKPVTRHIKVRDDVESFMPFGQYSMAMVVYAKKEEG